MRSIDYVGVIGVDVLWPTFREQKLHSAQVTLAGGHHEKGPALLVTDVNVGAVLQQQLRNLRSREKQRCTELTQGV